MRPVADPCRVTPDLHFPPSLTPSRECRDAATRYQLVWFQAGIVFGFLGGVGGFFEAGNDLLDQFSCERQLLNGILLQSSAFIMCGPLICGCACVRLCFLWLCV